MFWLGVSNSGLKYAPVSNMSKPGLLSAESELHNRVHIVTVSTSTVLVRTLRPDCPCPSSPLGCPLIRVLRKFYVPPPKVNL